MFSFLKKLFNIQNTDTNLLETNQQVELTLNNVHTRFEDASSDAKIKDIDSNIKKCKKNENDQKDELSSNLSTSYSNETASTSLESNVHASFESAISATYKSQRKSSKLAAKKIRKVVDDLESTKFVKSLQSNKSDHEISKCTKKKSSKKIELTKNKSRMHQRTMRFCHKCKSVKTMFGHVSIRKNCDKCGSMLLYLCTKCKEKYYASHKGWRVHENICNGKNTSQKLANVFCNLKVLNEKSMKSHLIKTEGNNKKTISVIFKCDVCVYQSYYKSNLKRHIKNFHMDKKKFLAKNIHSQITDPQSLRRHEQRLRSSK